MQGFVTLARLVVLILSNHPLSLSIRSGQGDQEAAKGTKYFRKHFLFSCYEFPIPKTVPSEDVTNKEREDDGSSSYTNHSNPGQTPEEDVLLSWVCVCAGGNICITLLR